MRIILSGIIVVLLSVSCIAQTDYVIPEFPGKSLRLAAAAQGYCTYPGRFGVSIDGKLMVRTNRNKDVFNELVFTGKAAHTPSINGGGFFSAFDGKQYNNISAVMLMAGYRINFGLPGYLNPDIDAIGGAFIEINAGGSYVHHIDDYFYSTANNETPLNYKTKRTWAPALSTVAGYSVNRRLDVIVSYTGAWPVQRKGKIIVSMVGAGMQFNF